MAIDCARCGEDVTSDTQKCPNCEYRPQKKMQLVGFIAFTLGVIVSLTVVGAIIGIPMAVFGIYRVYKGKGLTVDSEYGV